MTGPAVDLRSSFGSAAAAYAQHRPDYPATAVSWALEKAPGRRVLDLGAGTGTLTRALVALGCEVVAVEPDPAMLAELRAALPGVRGLPGGAESIPLPDGTVDAVVAGNAMHWFEMDRAGPEMQRVLAPGGVVAGLWNLMDDRVEWVAELAEVGGEEAIGPRDVPGTWPVHAAEIHRTLCERTGFGSQERSVFANSQSRTIDSLLSTFSTKAGVLVMAEHEREARLSQIRDFLSSREETRRGVFDLPMLTGVTRTQL